MEIIYEGMGKGKTTQLLELASHQEGYNLIVCCSLREVTRLWKIILKKEYKLPQPITFDDFIKKRYCGHNVSNIYIDNVDMLLQYMTTVNIGGITITKM